MSRGLDVGTMNLIAAEHQGEKTTLTQQRNAFVEVPLNDVAERMLARSQVPFVRDGNRVFIVGEDALNFANVLNVGTRRPMQNGLLSRDEKTAIPILSLLVEKLLGEPHEKGEKVFFTCPAQPADAKDRDVLYHQKTIEAVLRGLKYTPRVVNEGMSVVFSELADQRFTGLGISFGAGMTNMCLSYYGLPVVTTSVARGGDWIDARVAEATGESKDRVTAIKEKSFSLSKPTRKDEVQSALAIYYENLVEYAVRTLDREARKQGIVEGTKIPIAVTGGTSSAPGFKELFERTIRSVSLPFEVQSVRVAANPLYSVALGTLVAARAEESEPLPAMDEAPARAAARPAKRAAARKVKGKATKKRAVKAR